MTASPLEGLELLAHDGKATTTGKLADLLLSLAIQVPELDAHERAVRLASLLPRHRSIIRPGGWSYADEVLADVVTWLGSYEHARIIGDVTTPATARFNEAMKARWAGHAEVCRHEAATVALTAAVRELLELA